MTRRLKRLEPAASAPSNGHGIAALFSALGFVGLCPGLAVLGGSLAVIGGRPALGNDWSGAFAVAAWMVWGFCLWGFHLSRTIRTDRVPGHAPGWWLATFVHNAVYATGAAVVMYQDPHPGTLVTTLWFVFLSTMAVVAYRDDTQSLHRGR